MPQKRLIKKLLRWSIPFLVGVVFGCLVLILQFDKIRQILPSAFFVETKTENEEIIVINDNLTDINFAIENTWDKYLVFVRRFKKVEEKLESIKDKIREMEKKL